MSGYIDICPGASPTNPADKTAKRLAWIGRNPDNEGQTGAYFRGPVWIGGTSTANAPISVDSSGNVSIGSASAQLPFFGTLQLNLNNQTVKIANETNGTYYSGLTVTNNAYPTCSAKVSSGVVQVFGMGNGAIVGELNSTGGSGAFSLGDVSGNKITMFGNTGEIYGKSLYCWNQGDGGTYGAQGLRIGGYYLWVDGSGRLRVKLGAPSSLTDGTVVGTQS